MSNKWTDELKDEVVERYTEAEPTPETTMDIVKELAEEYGFTVNGVRMILSQKGVYVAKAAGAAKASDSDKPKRRSKADAMADLTAAITETGEEVDEAIVSKMTGKAMDYFTKVINSVLKEED